MKLAAESERRLVVGVADCRVSDDPGVLIVTHALGSCIAVIIHDPVALVGGLLHFMLPDSRLDKAKAEQNPYVFADTGVPRLFRDAYRLGAEKRRIAVRLAGGARSREMGAGLGDVGKKNILAVRRILWKAGVLIRDEETGGHQPREARLRLATGQVWIT